MSYSESSEESSQTELIEKVTKMYTSEKIFREIHSEIYGRRTNKKRREKASKIILGLNIKEYAEKTVDDNGLRGIINLKIFGVEWSLISITINSFYIEGLNKDKFEVNYNDDEETYITINLNYKELVTQFEGYEIDEISLTYNILNQEMLDFVKTEYRGKYTIYKEEKVTFPIEISLTLNSEDMDNFRMGG
jgi:hypothetical protein